MRTMTFVGAFLTCGSEVLLMHRGMHKKIAPGLWAGLGGKMEAHEMNDPMATCLREIEEESGITGDQLSSLRPRYVLTNLHGDRLSMIYYCIGSVKEKPTLAPCEEGTTHWVPIDELLNRPMSPPVRTIARHWQAHQESEDLWAGAIGRDGPIWTALVPEQAAQP